MEVSPRKIEIYTEASGHQPFTEWFKALTDKVGKTAILNRLDRVLAGNLGDCARYGAITEIRVQVGPGYRVYLAEDGPRLVILLGGGDKTQQSKDFRRAEERWHEYKRRKS